MCKRNPLQFLLLFYTKKRAASAHFLQITASLHSFSFFLSTFLHVSLRKILTYTVCSTSVACWRVTAGKHIPNTWLSKSKEKPLMCFPNVKEIPFQRRGPQTARDSKMTLFQPCFQQSPAQGLVPELLTKNSRFKHSGLFLERSRATHGFPGKLKAVPPRC